MNEVRDDLPTSEEEKNEKLQVQPNWRSGQIVLKESKAGKKRLKGRLEN